MAAPELTCPNCGAPLKVGGARALTARCSFCNTEVVLPPELQPLRTAHPAPARPGSAPRRLVWLWLAILLVLLFAIPALIARYQNAARMNALLEDDRPQANSRPLELIASTTPTPRPSPTPTPPYAAPALTFGQAGIGAGMFDDARYIAVDGQGFVYVADYQGGRIQRFTTDGQYLSQWRVGDSQTIIHGLTAGYAGEVFVAYAQVIQQYDGATGQPTGQLVYPEGGEFGALAATADGNLAAVWYEGRWGLITSLEGHREELVIFDAAGQIAQRLPNFISQQTNSLALDVELAVDGAGTVYALSDGVIFQFSPEGRFLDRINPPDEQPGQSFSPNGLAVDGQGRLFVVNGREISVYDAQQRFVDGFPSPAYVDALVVDAQGGIWGIADDQVIRFALR